MKAILKVWIFSVVAMGGLFTLLLEGCAHMKPYATDFYIPEVSASTNIISPNDFSQSIRSLSASVGGDEVWIIPRNPSVASAARQTPDSGSLLAKFGDNEIPLPLRHTDVKASVAGYIGTVDVTQQFDNTYSKKIEAVYVFPLPHSAAVNDFIMTIGKRHIRGIIRERKEAEAIYQEAKRQGYSAALMTEYQPNIFTQSIANLEPDAEIDVHIKYFQTLDYVDGWYEFVFPMVIAPGLNTHQTNSPGERNGQDISLHVDVDAGMAIEELQCKTHTITKSILSPEHFAVQLAEGGTIPNRDFVLRYRVASDRIRSDLLTHRDERGGYFTMMLYPPKEVENLPRQPLEIVFVLDCAMSGRPFEQAKAAVERGLRLLRRGDSFQIIGGSTSAPQSGPSPLEATPENVALGLNYLRSLNTDHSALVMDSFKTALDFPHDAKRLRFVCLLTDGFMGNETEILGEVHKRIGESRIFSIGLGASVNRYLLDHLAKTGRGAVAYLGTNDDAAKIMDAFIERTSHPALTDIKIDWGAMQAFEIYPREIPDLFCGRAVVLTGRFNGTGATAIRVTGNAGGAPLQFEIPANLSNAATVHKGLPNIWARIKIADLADQCIYAPTPQLPYEMKQVALDYNLVSPFTDFITVDASHVTEGEAAH